MLYKMMGFEGRPISMVKHASMASWAVWLITSFFLFFDILLRVFPNIMVKALQAHFTLDAAELSTLSASFMWAYGLMQLPAGMLIDRFGTKVMLSIGALIAAAGVFILSLTSHFWIACAGRFLMGVGAAFAFLGCMQVILTRFPEGQRALLAGLTMTVGALGGIVCNTVLLRLEPVLGYHGMLWLISGFGVFLAVMILLFVSAPIAGKSGQSVWHSFFYIVKQPSAWALGLLCGLIYLPYAIFNDLWGISFLRVVDGFHRIPAGYLITSIWLGWVIGSPIIGYLADRWQNPWRVMWLTTLVQIVVVVFLLFFKLPFTLTLLVTFCLGVTASSMALCYISGQMVHRNSAAGVSSAFINGFVSLVVFVTLPIIGYLMDYMAAKQAIHPLAILNYKPLDFQVGLIPLVVGLGIDLLVLGWLKLSSYRFARRISDHEEVPAT